jgi:nucleoside-diphosphate-sugar epimerase
MSGEKILITGATSHVGFRTLLDLLIAGYTPRIAVRSEAKKGAILNNQKFEEALTGDKSYEFIVVPDITTSGAYDEAIKGVDYAIHIASPIESGGRLKKESNSTSTSSSLPSKPP